jgi:RNA polymerase sigma factor (sigma-70 family)
MGILERNGADDARLVERYRAGDRAAFDAIHDRYSTRLERYAGRMLAGKSDHAEDVVQEAMLRASRALLRDDREIDLKPWLFRLTRNCALDELSRVRGGNVTVEDADTLGLLKAPATTEPAEAFERRTGVRDVLVDLAALPESQRHALVRREVDGLSHADVASELGLTEEATKSLVFRARANLVREREARTADCEKVRAQMLAAATAGRRMPPSVLRHVSHCPACRAFRRDLRLTDRAVALLVPGPLILMGLGALSLAGKGTAVKAGVATGTLAVAGAGAFAVGTTVFGPGDRSPSNVSSPAVSQRHLAAGERIPSGTAIVRHVLDLPAGPGRRDTIELSCPTGMRVADLLPPRGARLAVSYAPGTIVGSSRRARIVFEPASLQRRTRVVLEMLCKQPARSGSVVATDQRPAGRPTHTVRADEALLYAAPGGAAIGSVRRDQPVRVTASDGDWRRIVTDLGQRGWVRASVLAPVSAR